MIEQQEKKFTEEGMNESEVFQNTVAGFLDSISEKGPLYEKSEKKELITRAISFGELFNQLLNIYRGSKNLSQEQKTEIMKRIEALKNEAYFWTKQSESGRDFAKEVDDMAKSIWRR